MSITRFLFLGIVITCALVRQASAQLNYEPYQFNTFAGTASPGNSDGPGNVARFNQPWSVATDSAGNVYVVDNALGAIREVTPSGIVSTLAGGGGVGGDVDGTGASAGFSQPEGIAVDGSGNVYVSDALGDTIRKVTPSGVVTTVAGLANNPGSSDGIGSAARFRGPSALAIDTDGNLYVADANNHAIRRVSAAGVVTTLPGSFPNPLGMAIDPGGKVYVADGIQNAIYKLTTGGSTLVAGGGGSGSADGPTSTAKFNEPRGIACDSAGNIFVADTYNNTVRKISLTSNTVTTVAGSPTKMGSADGTGSAANFNQPFGVAPDGAGNVFVADMGNNTIRKITPDSVVSTFAGAAPGFTDGTGQDARFLNADGVAVDDSGNLFVADTGNNLIRKITPAGVTTTVAGAAGVGFTDGPIATAQFNLPESVALDQAGNIYVADMGNGAVRKITPDGMVSTLARRTYDFLYYPGGIAVDGAGNVYVSDWGTHIILKITPDGDRTIFAGMDVIIGSADGNGSAARFHGPRGLAFDTLGNLYVADQENHTIRKITPNADVTTVAGAPQQFGEVDGIGTAARFWDPTGIAVDSTGNLYVSDNYGLTIRKVTSFGVVTTLGGVSRATGNADGIGSAARFNSPAGVVLDNAGNLYIADSGNSTIRLAGPANNSNLSLTTGGLVNGHMMLTGSAPPNSSVTILATLSFGADFTGIATVTTNPVGFYRFEDTDTDSFSSRFYRASIADGGSAPRPRLKLQNFKSPRAR